MIAAKQTPTERTGLLARLGQGRPPSAAGLILPLNASIRTPLRAGDVILNQPRRRHHPGNPCLSVTPSVPVPCLGLHCTAALTARCPCPSITYPSCASAVHTEHAACHTYRIRLASHPAAPEHSPRRHGGTGVTAVAATATRKLTGQSHARQHIAHNSPTPPPSPTLRPKRPVSRSSSSSSMAG